MPPSSEDRDRDTRHDGAFPATRWTLVSQARQEGPDQEAAVEELCRRYWFPIYAFLRGKGHSPQDAEDLSQGFFQMVLEEGLFQAAQKERGKLRSLLLTILKRYVVDESRKAHAQKRGGGMTLVSIDVEDAERLYAVQPVDPSDPEKIFFKAWAASVLERARQNLREAFSKAPRADVSVALDPFLDPDHDRVSYPEFAERFGMSEGALRLHVHRLRKKLGELVKEEVRQTLDDPRDLEEELDWLRAALAG